MTTKNQTCVDWIHDYYHWTMNDVFDFFVRMIVVDYVYVFSSMLMLIDDWYYFLVTRILMRPIPTRLVDDESTMYHENLFDVDYYGYNNENCLTTT